MFKAANTLQWPCGHSVVKFSSCLNDLSVFEPAAKGQRCGQATFNSVSLQLGKKRSVAVRQVLLIVTHGSWSLSLSVFMWLNFLPWTPTDISHLPSFVWAVPIHFPVWCRATPVVESDVVWRCGRLGFFSLWMKCPHVLIWLPKLSLSRSLFLRRQS